MAVKYVKDFSFPSSGGFHGSVQRFAKGGHVTKVPAKAKASAKDMPARAKPNAPAKGAPKMASKPAVGKRQGYNEGGQVPGREMDRLPTKRPPGRMKDLAPARRFKGAYEGYEDGGEVYTGPPIPLTDDRGNPITYRPDDERPPPLPVEGPPPLPMEPLDDDSRRDDFLRELIRRDEERIKGDAAEQMRRLAAIRERESIMPTGDLMPLPEEPMYSRTISPAARRAAMAERASMRNDMGRSPGMRMRAPRMRAPVVSERMRSPYMPTYNPVQEPLPAGFVPSVEARYAKGGAVKGQAKVGKVMSEYKAGELHSGSKKGPLVKNPKQAVAIALSEARKSGAKIPRKEDGGLMASKPEVRKPKSVTVTKVTKTVSDAKDAALNEKKMLEFLRSLPKDEIADMMEKRAMQAPSMDPDMPKYRKGGMARKGVPVHKGKAMYGGGKC